MILVDSSVWVDYYRPGNRHEVKAIVKEAIAKDLVAINGVIMVEILGGISKKSDFQKVKSDFVGFHHLPLEPKAFCEASQLGSSLRRRGLTIPTTDLIIASSALLFHAIIYHQDHHFDLIARHIDIKVERLLK